MIATPHFVEVPLISCPDCHETYGLGEWRSLAAVDHPPAGMLCPSEKDAALQLAAILHPWPTRHRAPHARRSHERLDPLEPEWRSCGCGRDLFVPFAVISDASACGGFVIDADRYADMFPNHTRAVLEVVPDESIARKLGGVFAVLLLVAIVVIAVVQVGLWMPL